MSSYATNRIPYPLKCNHCGSPLTYRVSPPKVECPELKFDKVLGEFEADEPDFSKTEIYVAPCTTCILEWEHARAQLKHQTEDNN